MNDLGDSFPMASEANKTTQQKQTLREGETDCKKMHHSLVTRILLSHREEIHFLSSNLGPLLLELKLTLLVT